MRNNEKDKIRQEFAVRFRKALKELGFSPNQQSELQELFGVSGQAVRKWAEGQSLPTASRIPHVATVLGVRRAWLQDGELPMRPTVGRVRGKYDTELPDEEFSISGKEVELLHLFRALSQKERKTIIEVVTLLANGKKKHASQ
ncbi:MAG: helix-turn-helix domain-containing protein [Candidatus Thiodiazotropha endolucinida]